MTNKQTTVEWLQESMLLCHEQQMQFEGLFQQAKQMHKEQIINAHGIKNRGGFKSNGSFFVDEFTGEQYYNETYGN
jgi:hypothetical protein